MKLEFSPQIFEESTIFRFHEIRCLVAESFHTDRRTREDDNTFRISSNASKDAGISFP
jgi:hypothetical protein